MKLCSFEVLTHTSNGESPSVRKISLLAHTPLPVANPTCGHLEVDMVDCTLSH